MNLPESQRKLPSATEWERIDAIFNEVVQLSGSRQASRLAKLTAGDATLHAEVVSLLRHDQKSLEFPPVASEQRTLPASHRAGELLGRYRLLFPLAVREGSEVWCAEPVGATGERLDRVAIKFLRDMVSEGAFQRFRNETMLLARFQHPNIAQLLDCGRERGIPFFVMPYVYGRPITEFADTHTLTIAERLELMIRVCDALSYAHRFLVVHRDLKPANILVTDDRQPIVIDFGISKALDDGLLESNSVTTTTQRPMTPAYASPEQLHGDPVTTATDIHGLGLILYELISGHQAFSDVAHPTQPKLLDRISRSLPRRPSAVVSKPASEDLAEDGSIVKTPRMLAAQRDCSQRQLRVRLRESLDAITLRCLAKDPAERYQSVDELRHDLEDAIARQPVSFGRPSGYWRTWIRHRPRTSVCLAFAVSAILATCCLTFPLSVALDKLGDQVSDLESSLALTRREVIRERQAWREKNAALLTIARGNLPQNRETDFLAPPTQAYLARLAAEKGDCQRALRILTKLSPADDAMRLEMARAYQLLGRPGNALDLLGHSKALPQNAEQAILYLNLLLDAKRNHEAEAFEKSCDFELLKPQAGKLALARYRRRIGWEDGAQELLVELRESANQYQLSTNELLELAFLDGELATLRTVTSTHPKTLAIRGRALNQEAMELIKVGAWDEARRKLRDSLSLFESDCPRHIVAFEALRELSQLEQKANSPSEALRLSETLWRQVNEEQELGTAIAVWAGVEMLRMVEDDGERKKILASLQLRPEVFQDPYLRREVLTYQFEVDLRASQWETAERALTQLVPLESTLWGEKSVEHAYALAALAHTWQIEGDPRAPKAEAKLAKIIEELKTKLPDVPARIFLAAINCTHEVGLPSYQWIHLYLMHRFNTPQVQREMIVHVTENLLDEAALETKAMLQSALRNARDADRS